MNIKLQETRQVFLDDCRRVVQSESIQEKVSAAHRLATAPYLELLKKDIQNLDSTLMQPNSLGRYPYDLRPVEKPPKHPARPIHFKISGPKDIEKRSSIRKIEGQRQLIHSIAHIELCAVEIDAAMLLMYPHAPPQWTLDWVSIMQDEQKHFLLLCGLLKDLDIVYGDFPVHFALWETAMSCRSWLEQIAIVNRYQEAGGVDSSNALMGLLREIQSQATARIFEMIHADEIRHVNIGTQWWNWAFSHYRLVQRPNIPLGEEMGQKFFEIVKSRIVNPWSARVPLDRPGRRKAGFSQYELDTLDAIFLEKSQKQ